MLTNSRLPEKESDFFNVLTDYFPCFFDIKVPLPRSYLPTPLLRFFVCVARPPFLASPTRESVCVERERPRWGQR